MCVIYDRLALEFAILNLSVERSHLSIILMDRLQTMAFDRYAL